jgi:hypothetical protein
VPGTAAGIVAEVGDTVAAGTVAVGTAVAAVAVEVVGKPDIVAVLAELAAAEIVVHHCSVKSSDCRPWFYSPFTNIYYYYSNTYLAKKQ